jgi:hypothetical protein
MAIGLLPELFVGNLLRPSDVEVAPETVVNEYLEFIKTLVYSFILKENAMVLTS